MPLARGQLMLLGTVGVFFALQLLPHHITRLHSSLFGFFYPLLAVLVGLLIMIGGAITFVMWISTRDDESRLQHRNWFATFALMFTGAITLSLSSSAYARGLPTGSFAKEFDQQLWDKPSSSKYVNGDITERQKMLGDTVRTIVVNGSKENIIATLGQSEDDAYFSSTGRDLIYCMGPQRDSFPVDDEWLLIWFDSDGRTTRYEIWSD